MTSNTLRKCCVSGLKHEGESTGEIKEVGGIKCYIATNPEKTTQNAILYLPDAFGLELINNRLLADDFARAGYLTIIPDIFRGNPVPEALLTNPATLPTFSLPVWLAEHPLSVLEQIIEKTIKGMKEELGVKNIGAVGYCFGGKYVIRLLEEGKDKGVKAGFTAHPSFVEMDEIEKIGRPLSIAAAEIDDQLSAPKRHAAEALLGKKATPYEIVLYGGCHHGFAVRTDLKDKRKRFIKESAYYQAVRWFDEYVKD